MQMPGRRALVGLALGGAALLAAAPGGAQVPDGPVTVLVPYTPGTGMDILARLLAPHLQARLGQAVLVENRPGASGNIGTQAVARAAPDGRTLMLQANTFVMNPSLFRQVPYDPVGSFTPVIHLTLGELVLAVNPDVPARDAREFVRFARGGEDDGGKAPPNYASPGIGTPQHLAMELFSLVARVRLNHVPYRGSAPAVQDLIGRRVAAMVLPVHTALPLAAAGQVRLLALGSPARSAAIPDVPTMAEAGFPGAEVDLWYGLLGPAGLAEPLVARLNAEVNDWLRLPATAEQLRAQGMQPVGGTPDAFAALIARDLDRWAGVIRQAGLAAD
jgi:tripartite-type tricarboxylate transporter receptor subunit TctC